MKIRGCWVVELERQSRKEYCNMGIGTLVTL